MKRAKLVHFQAIITEKHIAIRASLTMKENIYSSVKNLDKFSPRFPIQAYKLLNAYQFKMLIIGKDQDQNITFQKEFESDSYGNFSIKIPVVDAIKDTHVLELFEVGRNKGLDILLGNFIPLSLVGKKKLVICDFDKTLVDTRYSTPEEIYKSLTSPIESFPTVTESVDKIKEYIKEGYQPFILSASPHFYEDAMRDWLYANDIYTAGIFLKDYRKVFSIFEGDLTPKDIKKQGIYKLNHLLDIVHMTGIPDEIVLMGDNFESDPLIYLTFYELLLDRKEPRQVWNRLKDYEAFSLGSKQNSLFLNKIFQLNDLIKRESVAPKIKIFIRKKDNESNITIPDNFQIDHNLIELYETPSRK